MSEQAGVERMYPFVLRSRILILGKDNLARSKSRLHFVLIVTEVNDKLKAEVLAEFRHYPVIQHYTSQDLETHFGVHNAKVVGFAKSGLAQSIYAELKSHRLNPA